jgi:hypothetical protein
MGSDSQRDHGGGDHGDERCFRRHRRRASRSLAPTTETAKRRRRRSRSGALARIRRGRSRPPLIEQLDQRHGQRRHGRGRQQSHARPRGRPSRPPGWRIRSAAAWLHRLAKKGMEAAPAAWASMAIGAVKSCLAVGHQRDCAVGGGGKVGDDPAVGGHQRNADHQRDGEPHPLAQALVAASRG